MKESSSLMPRKRLRLDERSGGSGRRIRITSVSESQTTSTGSSLIKHGQSGPSSSSSFVQDVNNSNSNSSGRRSPEEKCPICISAIEKRSFTSECFHTFCYLCLYEWSKVKPECPVCRQQFTKIITNVTAMDCYDEVPVPSTSSTSFLMGPTSFFYAQRAGNSAGHEILSRFDHILACPRNVTSAQLVTPLTPHEAMIFPSQFMQQSNNLVPPAGTVAHRRYIYHKELYVLPYGNGDNRRVRQCSPSLYKENPAWTLRLMNFLKQELLATVENVYERNLLSSMIAHSLRKHDILSVPFKRMVEPYFGPLTGHFIHEFYNFARSSFELEEYYRLSTYVRKSEAIISRTVSNDATVFVIEDSDQEEQTTSSINLGSPEVEEEDEEEEEEEEDEVNNRLINANSDGDIEVLLHQNDSSSAAVDIPYLSSITNRRSNPTSFRSSFNVRRSLPFVATSAESPDKEKQREAKGYRQEEEEEEEEDLENPKPGPSGLSRLNRSQLVNTSLTDLRKNYYDDDSDDSDSDFDRRRFHYARHFGLYNVKTERDTKIEKCKFDASDLIDTSEDDSIEIIGFVKPIHERTPELIELTDDEDCGLQERQSFSYGSSFEILEKGEQHSMEEGEEGTTKRQQEEGEEEEEEEVELTCKRHDREDDKGYDRGDDQGIGGDDDQDDDDDDDDCHSKHSRQHKSKKRKKDKKCRRDHRSLSREEGGGGGGRRRMNKKHCKSRHRSKCVHKSERKNRSNHSSRHHSIEPQDYRLPAFSEDESNDSHHQPDHSRIATLQSYEMNDFVARPRSFVGDTFFVDRSNKNLDHSQITDDNDDDDEDGEEEKMNERPAPTYSNIRSHSPSIYLNLSSTRGQQGNKQTSASPSSSFSPASSHSSISLISSISSISSSSSSSSTSSIHSSVSSSSARRPSFDHHSYRSLRPHRSTRPCRNSMLTSERSSLASSSRSTSRRSISSNESNETNNSQKSSATAMSHRSSTNSTDQSIRNQDTANLISDSLAVINNITRNVNIALNRLPSVIGSVNFKFKDTEL